MRADLAAAQARVEQARLTETALRQELMELTQRAEEAEALREQVQTLQDELNDSADEINSLNQVA